MDVTSNLLSVHQFIKQIKGEENGQLSQYHHFTELSSKQINGKIAEFILPKSDNVIQKFIHGDVFEYSVQQAARHVSHKDAPWEKFRQLYPDIKPREKNKYIKYMQEAGCIAWELFEKNVRKIYGRNNKSIAYSFGYHIWNNTFPSLTKKLEADMFVTSEPNVVCDIKYSTMTKEKYEEEYLVHAVIQVLIYSLVLDLDPTTLHLRVLVFYSRTNEAVLYESTIHEQKRLVSKLFKKLTGKQNRDTHANRTKMKEPQKSETDSESPKRSTQIDDLITKSRYRKEPPCVTFIDPRPEESTEDEDFFHALNEVIDNRHIKRSKMNEISKTNILQIKIPGNYLWILVFAVAVVIVAIIGAIG